MTVESEHIVKVVFNKEFYKFSHCELYGRPAFSAKKREAGNHEHNSKEEDFFRLVHVEIPDMISKMRTLSCVFANSSPLLYTKD